MENHKYKVGDTVTIRADLVASYNTGIVPEMLEYRGKQATITQLCRDGSYRLSIDGHLTPFAWEDDNFEEPNTRYCFICDNDCHWYLIPAKFRDEFREWVKSMEGEIPTFETHLLYEACEISFPEQYTFDNPIMDN